MGRLVEEIVGLRKGGYDHVEGANVQRFISIVRAFAESRLDRPGLSEMLVYLDLLLTAGPEDDVASDLDVEEANTVKLMTAHASKGLEWPIVFVAGANKSDFRNRKSADILPTALAHPAPGRPERSEFSVDQKGSSAFGQALKSWEEELHELEELRVLYVAITRAREHLTISWSRTHPNRVKNVELLPALKRAAELCTRLNAEPADVSTATAPAFREIAAKLLANVQPFLDGEADNPATAITLAETLTGQWGLVGGDPAVVSPAVDQFLQQRAATREYLQVIQAIDARNAADEGNALLPGAPISSTQLETYRACPHRYYLRYVAGLPGMPSRHGSARGIAFHHAIATEATRRSLGQDVAHESVRGWFETDAALAGDQAPSSRSQSGRGGNRLIDNYLASSDATATPLLIEAAFSMKIGDTILRGVVDRVHRLPDGSTEVVDYKTDRVVRSEADVKRGWQLPIYLLACQDVFKEIQPTPRRAVMFFVGANKKIEITYTEAELNAFRSDLADATGRLRSVSKDRHTAGVEVCKACEFRQVCSFKVAESGV